MFRKRRLLVSIVALILAIMIVVPLLLNAFLVGVSAASSSELKKQLDELREQANEIAASAEAIDDRLSETEAETATTVERKALLDQQIEITRLEIENTQAQIQQYNLLIAAKQEELDAALVAEAEMNETYKLRLRAMEENGSISYWEVLFGASSFSDLLSRVDMIAEIAQSDQLMLEQLATATAQVELARISLEEEKLALQQVEEQLAVQEQEMTAQRAQADDLITSLAADAEALRQVAAEYDALEDEVRAELAEINEAYEDALAEEERQRLAALAAQQAASSSSSSSSGYRYPLPYRVSITDAYGYRYHPIYGYYAMHWGVDFAASYGTPIYATKGGVVTVATYGEANGYYVTINHGNGTYSTYAHMPYLSVSVGQSVSQGEVIGYVGSTGWSSGPHLHFELVINGSHVNPMDYVG